MVIDEKAVFDAALALPDAKEREAYLQDACSGRPELLGRLRELLSAHEGSQGPLDRRPTPLGITADAAHTEVPGIMIGPYKLLQQIGEGGMGVVWMAEQTEPVQRKVALKVIKPGMDSRQVIARFEAERQALAMMDHVNIARVFDGGTTGVRDQESGVRKTGSAVRDQESAGLTPDSCLLTPRSGRPYFVMELVHGVPITKYCDDNHLTPRERLELFVPVCQAIQHAHQKGIIHRDIKPSNVMVTLYDGKPVPKVIDFGVAKATEQKLTERTLFTQYGTMVGTLEYMSPEQAEMSALGVDTRSDIYSLGVLLYELLTGSTPLTHKRMKEAAYAEILRMIKEEEPPKPSTRLTDSGEALASISANRHTEPAKLTKLVRGELDWIVMKCLEKDRNRRYETANGFAQDLQRYLVDEPVQACPPSAGYRLRKFVRRNKGPVLAASLVALALVGGVIGTTWGMLRATFAEAEAIREAGEKTVALGEKTVALGEKETALAAAKANEIQAKSAQKDAQENLKDALAAVDQMLTRVAEDKLLYVPQMEPIRRDLLLDALKFYQKFLEKQSDDPMIRREAAFAHRRVGRIHHQLGQHKEAEQAFRNAFAMYDKLGSSSFADPGLLRQMVSCHIEFSWPLYHLGKFEESRQHIRRAVEVADKLDKKAPGNRACILNARNNLASILLSQEPHEAEKILKENLVLAEDAFDLEAAHRGLGTVFMFTGRLPEAEESARQAMKYAEQMAAENPSANWVQAALANDQRALASVIMKQRPKEAQVFQGRAIVILDKLATDFPMGPTYRRLLAEALIEDAGLLKQLGQTADAEKAYRRAVDVYEKLATDFPTMPAFWQSTFDQRLKLGQFLKEAGKINEASGVYSDADAIVSKLPTDVPGRLAHWLGLARAHCELGRMLSHAGKKQEAEAAFRQAVTLSEKLEADFAGKPEHRRELAHSHTLAALDLAGPRLHADADRLYGWALQHLVALTREAPQAKQSEEQLAFLHSSLGGHHLWGTGRLKDADRSYRAALEIYEKLALEFPAVPAYRAAGAELRIHLGIVAYREGRSQQAEQNLRQGIQLAEEVAKELPGDGNVRVSLGYGYRWLAATLRDAGSPQEVEKSLVQSLAVLDKFVAEFPNNDWGLNELSSTCRFLAEHHFKSGRTEEGRRFEQRALELSEQVQANYIAPYRKAVEIAPNDATARYNLGAALQRQKKLDEAAAAYRKATELDPKAVNAHDALGLVLRVQRKLDDAAAVYRRLIELEPNQANWYSNLGGVLREQMKLDEAIAAYRKAIELDPKHAAAYEPLASALVAGGRGAEAIPLIDEYVRRAEGEGRRPIGLIVLRFRHFEQGKDALGCRATAEIWERLKPTDVLDFYNAACFRAATAAVLRAADGSPKAAESAAAEADRAMHWLGKAVAAGYTSAGYIKNDKDLDALRDREDFKKLVAALARAAVAPAEKAVAEAPKDANRWHTLGKRRYDAGDYEGAVTALQKYHELTNGEEEWANPFWLAKAHWRLGNTDEAKRWYDRGVQWMGVISGRTTAAMIRIRNETAELLKIEKKKN